MSDEVVGDMSEWSGMLSEFFRQIKDKSKTKEQVQAFLENRNPFVITDVKSEWVEFYRKYFRLNVDFSAVIIPADPGGHARVIFIPKGLTIMQVVKAMRKKFGVYLYAEEMDKVVRKNDRVADHNYAIRVRDRVDADEELNYLSANQLKMRGDIVITLLERLVYELKYFDETGSHLDIDNWTLCAGSLSSDGNVPNVRWYSRNPGLHIDPFFPDFSTYQLRARSVVC